MKLPGACQPQEVRSAAASAPSGTDSEASLSSAFLWAACARWGCVGDHSYQYGHSTERTHLKAPHGSGQGLAGLAPELSHFPAPPPHPAPTHTLPLLQRRWSLRTSLYQPLLLESSNFNKGLPHTLSIIRELLSVPPGLRLAVSLATDLGGPGKGGGQTALPCLEHHKASLDFCPCLSRISGPESYQLSPEKRVCLFPAFASWPKGSNPDHTRD